MHPHKTPPETPPSHAATPVESIQTASPETAPVDLNPSSTETSATAPTTTPPEVMASSEAPANQPAPPSPSLEEQLHLAEQKASEHHDAWLRAKAEGENIRRRAQEDISKAHKFAVERFASDLLAVKDSLEAALNNQNQSAESLHSGVDLTLKQLVAAFGKSGLKEIHPVGDKFDPHFHQAIGMLESDQEPNTVVNVLQKGYLIADRVLRPALVMVAKARSTPNEPPAA